MTESWAGLARCQSLGGDTLGKSRKASSSTVNSAGFDFDSRVLALAKEKTVPLGERIKFAAIFGSNMDEFFMVRVGSLYDQTLLKKQ